MYTHAQIDQKSRQKVKIFFNFEFFLQVKMHSMIFQLSRLAIHVASQGKYKNEGASEERVSNHLQY